MPVPELMVAMVLLLLAHDTPGVVALARVPVLPMQALVVPVMAAGVGLTVTSTVRAQPVLNV
jgi:hypothetical protein